MTLDADGFPMEIKRQGASKHRLGHWVRIWHRRQGLPGRQSVVVTGILRITEQMTDNHLWAVPAEAPPGDGTATAISVISPGQKSADAAAQP